MQFSYFLMMKFQIPEQFKTMIQFGKFPPIPFDFVLKIWMNAWMELNEFSWLSLSKRCPQENWQKYEESYIDVGGPSND